jgi:hypothetical protein
VVDHQEVKKGENKYHGENGDMYSLSEDTSSLVEPLGAVVGAGWFGEDTAGGIHKDTAVSEFWIVGTAKTAVSFGCWTCEEWSGAVVPGGEVSIMVAFSGALLVEDAMRAEFPRG